jgi:hypothetical protein
MALWSRWRRFESCRPTALVLRRDIAVDQGLLVFSANSEMAMTFAEGAPYLRDATAFTWDHLVKSVS